MRADNIMKTTTISRNEKTPAKQQHPRRKYATEFDPAELATRDLLTPAEAAWVLHIGESLLYKLIMDLDPATGKPRLHSVKVGRRRLIPRKAIDRYIDRYLGAVS